MKYYQIDSHLYLMKCNRTGFYKIGKSKQPRHREKTLQAETPSIVMIAVFNGQGWQERDWHINFTKHRIRGEWFDLTKIQVAYMCQKLKNSIKPEALEKPKAEKQKSTLIEIKNRLIQVIRAERDVRCSNYEYSAKTEFFNAIREKHNIPQGVYLFGESGLRSDDIRHFMSCAKLWNEGEMSETVFNDFLFHYGEIAEVDYFWVLMNKPAFFYHESNSVNGYKELEDEFKLLGITPRKKLAKR